jgi:trimeric autotransporter adhesin
MRTRQGIRAKRRALALLILMSAGGTLAAAGAPAATSFVYQGQLQDSGQPANGRYDIRLSPFVDAYGSATLAEPLIFPGVEVRDGNFRLEFELGPLRAEHAWLELAVSDANANRYSTIAGRSKAVAAGPIGQCWSTTGDAGSTPATHFLGTTDAQPLVLRTHNARSLGIEPSAVLFGGVPITANMIGGSWANQIDAGVRGATIAGGGLPLGDTDPQFLNEAPNRVSDSFGVVGGGFANQAGNADPNPHDRPFSTVGGGYTNLASGQVATIAGGAWGTASGNSSAIAGGVRNSATAEYSAVLGGQENSATGRWSAVAGGRESDATGDYAFVAGGQSNCAGGLASWAGGSRAKVRPGATSGNPWLGCSGVPQSTGSLGDAGSFVWADSQPADFVTTGRDQFMIRAQGGVGINAAPLSAIVELMVSGNDQFANFWLKGNNLQNNGILFSTGDEQGTNNASFYIDHYNGTLQGRRVELVSNGSVTIRSNITGANTGVVMPANSGAWGSLSDRSVKTAIRAIDPIAILEQLIATPISSWSYIAQGESIRHIGPMAQDLARFGFGESDTHISTVDADGIALAAIQGLNTKLEAEKSALQQDIEDLKFELAELRSLVLKAADSGQ